LTQARAEWNAERDGWERDMTTLQAAAGLWIEQSSQAVRIARSELKAAVSERQQVIAERDRMRADLAARLHAWENSPRRKFLALFMRAIGKSAWKAPTSGN
jgi:hypothetical protein